MGGMKLGYDKEALTRLIQQAGGNLRIVEKALLAAQKAQPDSSFVTEGAVLAQIAEMLKMDHNRSARHS